MLESSNRFSECVLLTPGYPHPHSQICLLHVSPTIAVWQSEKFWKFCTGIWVITLSLFGNVGLAEQCVPHYPLGLYVPGLRRRGAGTRRTKNYNYRAYRSKNLQHGASAGRPGAVGCLGRRRTGGRPWPGHGGHGPHSSHDWLMVKETCRLCSPAVGAVLRRCKALAMRRYFYGLSQLRRSGGPWFCCLLALRSCIMLSWSDPAFPQVLESDFSKNRSGHSTTVNAAAGERSGVGLLEVTESDFPSLSNSADSCLVLSSSACARLSRGARAVACARVCLRSSSSAEFAAVAHAHATTLHDACNSGGTAGLLPVQRSTSFSLGCGGQGPTGRRSTKGGVSGPAEDLLPVSEVEAGVNCRPAGGVRWQVASSLPGRQPGTGTRRVREGREGAVTPSLHPEVPDTQFVSPGRGFGIKQSMGWMKGVSNRAKGVASSHVT